MKIHIKVWYFDNKPVCISWQPYRKSSETFEWLSKEDYDKVKQYIYSLRCEDDKTQVNIVDDERITLVIEEFEKIDYKKHEVKNLIK